MLHPILILLLMPDSLLFAAAAVSPQQAQSNAMHLALNHLDDHACRDLMGEYETVCAGKVNRQIEPVLRDFCDTYDKVCLSKPQGVTIAPSTSGTTAVRRSSTIQTSTIAASDAVKSADESACQSLTHEFRELCHAPTESGTERRKFCDLYRSACPGWSSPVTVISTSPSPPPTSSLINDDYSSCWKFTAKLDCSPEQLFPNIKVQKFCEKFQTVCPARPSPPVAVGEIPATPPAVAVTQKPVEDKAVNPDCAILKSEYESICLDKPVTVGAEKETQQFCQVYQATCPISVVNSKALSESQSFPVGAQSNTPSFPPDDPSCLLLRSEFEAICRPANEATAPAEVKAFCDGYRQVCKNLLSARNRAPLPAGPPDDASCPTLKSEYYDICFKPPPPSTVNETRIFCDLFQTQCQNLLAADRAAKEPVGNSPDDPSCPTLKGDYDEICSKPPSAGAVNETRIFCDAFRTMCSNLLSAIPSSGGRVATLSSTPDDPACVTLKVEYDAICTRPGMVPAEAIAETKLFCDAFGQMCQNLLIALSIPQPIDWRSYCFRHRDRYRYVCPDPFRFGEKYGKLAVDFCPRYHTRCPRENLPREPQMFHKEKFLERHLKILCERYRQFALDYCTNPVIVKMPRYYAPCAVYKDQCVDIYSRVIYFQAGSWIYLP